MEEKIRYRIAFSAVPTVVEEQVHKLMEKGYVPYGSPFMWSDYCVQAMVLKEDA